MIPFHYKLAVVLLAVLVFESRGEVTIYSNPNDFAAAVDVETTIDFDAFPVGEVGEDLLEPSIEEQAILIEDVAIRSASGCFAFDPPCWEIANAPDGNYLLSKDIDFAFENLQILSFETSQDMSLSSRPHVSGLGFRVVSGLPAADLTNAQMTFHVGERSGEFTTTSVDAADFFGSGDGWIGFSSSSGIAMLVVEDPQQLLIPFGLDDIARSEIVPEPSSYLMTLFAAILMFIGMRRTSRRVAV